MDAEGCQEKWVVTYSKNMHYNKIHSYCGDSDK